MANYYNRRGGCVSGECEVLMASGENKAASNIRKGDFVLCENGKSAKVLAVVETMCEGGKSRLCCFKSGLRITPKVTPT